MSNRKMIWILLLVVISCVCLNSSSIFASENDENVKVVLQKLQKAFNEKDVKTAVSVFHPNARIKTGNTYVSREEYEKRLPERMEKFGTQEYDDIDIVIKDNKAAVNAIILFTQSGRRLKIKYTMILEEGKWWIIDQDY
jgi:nitric oxide synthase oxygenase domain/subunit